MSTGLRRILLPCLAAALVLTQACAAPEASPTSKDPFEPSIAVTGVTANILIPEYSRRTSNKEIVTRLNGTLAQKGLNVTFELSTSSYDSSGNNSFLTKARTELAAGDAKADAYALPVADSKKLFNESLTMDVTDLVRTNAPSYYSNYSELFGDKLMGIPVSVYSDPLYYKAAFMLREDFESTWGGIRTLDDFFAFIDEVIVEPESKYAIQSFPELLMSQWALDQGYYQLNGFGADGYLFAAINDETCTPVGIESIPGLKTFFTKIVQYYMTGVLDPSYGNSSGREIIAYVRTISEFTVSSPDNWTSWAAGSYTAHVFTPELPAIYTEPLYAVELAVPAACPVDKAVEIVRFVEWANASQENYDTVIYGEKDVDYSLSGKRFTVLSAGEPVDLTKNELTKGLFCTWPGISVLGNSDFYRLPASAPANVEQLVEDGLKLNLRFPVNKYIHITTENLQEELDISDETLAICKQRKDILDGMIYSNSVSELSGDTFDRCMEDLKKTRTDLVVADYTRFIKELKEKS